MLHLKQLWQDESGVVLSAEVVTVGTLGVLGAVVGLNAAGNALDGELKEFSSAIRHLDQSYHVAGHRSCRAWTAGSCYQQPEITESDVCATDEGNGPQSTGARPEAGDGKAKLPALEPQVVKPNQIPAGDSPAVKSKATPAKEAPRKKKKTRKDDDEV